LIRFYSTITITVSKQGSEDLISTIQSTSEDLISTLQSASERINNYDAERFSTKTYNVQPKPLFSALELRSLAMTSRRSFLMHYLPLLQHGNFQVIEV
jgi:hypothetical protein